MIVTRDYHGFKLNRAIRDAENLIANARQGSGFDVEFIVGRGIIKQKLIMLLGRYNIEGHEKLGNSGIIVAHLE